MVPIGSFLRWLSSTAGYVPGNEAQLSLSDLLTTSGSSLVVATRFYPGAQKTFRSSWQAFRHQLRASLATANRSAFALSQSLTTPFAVPSLVSKGSLIDDRTGHRREDGPAKQWQSTEIRERDRVRPEGLAQARRWAHPLPAQSPTIPTEYPSMKLDLITSRDNELPFVPTGSWQLTLRA
jgi:hypothetical protein